MDVNKEIGSAAVFAQGVWVAVGLYLYLMTPGSSLLSGSAGVFFIGGIFVAPALFGTAFYGLRRALATVLPVPAGTPAARMAPIFDWVLPVVEALVIFVAAGLTFQQIETWRTGVPLEYVQERTDFDYALKAFSVASELEEQAQAGRDSGKVDAEVETRLVELLELGVAKGSGVSDAFLNYLDPKLKEPYRTQLLRGHQLLVEGRRSGDVAKQTEGNELVREFYNDFLPSRADGIVSKLGVRAQ
jgi:hypothetical protein